MLAILAFTIFAASAACTATDGDTIRCRWNPSLPPERIRLLGIDAPEMPGHCRRGRLCVTGDPSASKAALSHLLLRSPITIRRFGIDRYGRTLALISAGGVDLSCAQLAHGTATYRPQWDNRGALAAICPRHLRDRR